MAQVGISIESIPTDALNSMAFQSQISAEKIKLSDALGTPLKAKVTAGGGTGDGTIKMIVRYSLIDASAFNF